MKHIFAKKSLGQNFLKSQKALHTMVEAGRVVPDDIVVEIGPGKGALTKVLLETGAIVIAFEKDHRLIGFLQEEFAQYIENKKFFLYEKDILDVDMGVSFLRRQESSITEVKQQLSENSDHSSSHHESSNFESLLLDSCLRRNDKSLPSYKLIANIPYYITGEITRRFLTTIHKPQCMVLLVQKEVADRIVDTKESILSLSIKIFGIPKKVMIVKKEFFSPSPKVDSAIIQISDIHNPFKNNFEEKKFFEYIKKAFGQKRKKLNTTLKEYKEEIKDWEIIKDKRPEEIGVKEWRQIVGI